MNRIQQRRTIAFVATLVSLLAFAFCLRLINLTKIPVFADEAIYIRWAQVMRAEPTLRFLPLSDGKQPLFMWGVIPFFKIFSDPLFAARMLSVFSGVVSMLGIAVLSLLLFKSKRAAIFAAFLYAISPFTYFFDRMALVDSTLSMFGVWFLVFLTLAIQRLRWDFAMLAGFALGGALLTKSPGLFFLLLMPSSLFLTTFPQTLRGRSIHLIRIVGLWLTTGGIGFAISQLLRLGPNYHMIASRNLDYVYPVTHLFENARDPFIFNIDRALEWLVLLGPVWLIIFAVLGVLHMMKIRSGSVIFLLAFFAGPFLVGSMFAKVFTARYILYTLPPLFILAGASTLYVKKLRLFVVALTLIFMTHALYINIMLLTKPESAPLPASERSGYFIEWSAGSGIKESANIILEEHAKNPDEKIVVGTEGFFGTLPDGLQIYLEKVPNVVVLGTGLNFKDIPGSLKDARKAGNTVYFAVNSSRLNKDFKKDGLTLVYSYAKPLRATNTHEYVSSGPQETYFLFKLD